MKPRRFRLILLLALVAGGVPSPAARAALVDCLSEAEFRALAGELSSKVNFFSEAWSQDPAAEFYGGTTRDYLYWIKGKFQECKDPAEGRRIADRLRREPTIDVRDFIIGDSDVDVVSAKNVRIDPGHYGVAKIDSISPEIFDPASDKGQNELVQGYIPAEKVRLTKDGIHAPEHFGDGLGEIYSGKLTVHFTAPEVFAEGHYAKQGINHPILLALRYERLLGIDYFKTHGAGLPDKTRLFAIDPASEAAVRQVIADAKAGNALKPFLERPQFKKWFNGAIQKSFRSYTNPTAAQLLMKHLGVADLTKLYDGIEPLNQYVFQRYRDEKAIAKNLATLPVRPEELFTPVASRFPDGHLYHGTKTEEAFRGILLQGFLPSENGSGGAGLYGVSETNRKFAEDWGHDPKRLIRIPLKSDAKLVDITTGPGERAWTAYVKAHGQDFEAFANFVGADLLRYPYTTEAYVVENGAVLGRPEGVYRKILTLSAARALAQEADTLAKFNDLAASLRLNGFSFSEIASTMELLPFDPWKVRPATIEEGAKLLSATAGGTPLAKWLLERPGAASEEWFRALLDRVQTLEEWNLVQGPDYNPALRGSRELFDSAAARLREAGAFRSLQGPYKNAEEFFNAIGSTAIDNRMSQAKRKALNPEIIAFLNGVSHPADASLLLEERLRSNKHVLSELLNEAERKILLEHWAQTGALANFVGRPPGFESYELRFDGLRKVDGAFRKPLEQLVTANLREYLHSRTDGAIIGEIFRSSTGSLSAEHLSKEEIRDLVQEWRNAGVYENFVGEIKSPAELAQRADALLYRGGHLKETVLEEVMPLLRRKAHDLFAGQSLVAEAIRKGESPAPAMIATWLASSSRDEFSDHFFADFRSNRLRAGDWGYDYRSALEAFKSPLLYRDPAVAEALLADPALKSHHAALLWKLLSRSGSGLAAIADRPGVLENLFSRFYSNGYFPTDDETTALRGVLDRVRRQDPPRYAALVASFFEGLGPSQWLYYKPSEWLQAELLQLVDGDPVFRSPAAASWIEGFVERLDGQSPNLAVDRALELLRRPEVQRMEGASRWLELLLRRPLYDGARIDRTLIEVMRQEPWASHPRAGRWKKALSMNRTGTKGILGTKYHELRSEYLGEEAGAGTRDEAAIERWRRRLVAEKAPVGGAGAASRPAPRPREPECRGLFSRIFGGRR